MAEFDYEVVDGRKIRVRPQEVVSEIDENGYFVRQPNHFTEDLEKEKNPGRKRQIPSGMGKALPTGLTELRS